jgi:acyl-homoserine-lactone acylase
MAIHRSRTEENQTFLLVNPHVPIEGALRWYEAYLHSDEGWQVLGGFFPGSLAPGLGTTPHHGWAVTFNWPDFVDIYELKMHPKNPRLYRVDEAWETLRVEKVRLQVRLFAPRGKVVQGWPVQGFSPVRGPFLTVSRKLEWSLFGPVVRTKKGVYALRFPAEKLFRAPEEWYRLSKAQNFTEFYQALRLQGIPHFNFVYADPDTIFYLFNATLPERPAGWNWQGVLPGDTRKTLWQRYLTIEELPQVLNPDCGYVFSVNNSPFLVSCPEASPRESDYPPGHGWEWNRHNNRELRLRELMEGKERFPGKTLCASSMTGSILRWVLPPRSGRVLRVCQIRRMRSCSRRCGQFGSGTYRGREKTGKRPYVPYLSTGPFGSTSCLDITG